MIKILEAINHSLNITEWSTFWRRAFVLTLPISGPIYILYMSMVAAIAMPVLFVMIVFLLIGMLWEDNDTEVLDDLDETEIENVEI